VCAIDLYLHPEGGLDREAVKEGLEWVGTIDGIDVFKNLKALPRVRLVGNLVVLDDTERLFEYCASPSFNPKTTAVTDVPPASGLPDSSDRIQGKATILATSSTKVVIDAEADADCVLVLADAYYPGWKAYVNAKEVEVFPVYHAFRGVVMPAGRHTIEFRMWPNSFASALGVSCAALFASSIVAALHLVRAGRRN
jgi:hypothetical protein